jgi:flagellar hook-basal body complex protein FliE
MAITFQGGPAPTPLALRPPESPSTKQASTTLQPPLSERREAFRLPSEVNPPPATPSPGTSFAERLEQIVNHVDGVQKQADATARDFANGKHNDIHGTMIQQQEAEISLRFAANIRNRLIEAYREVMRMGA